MPLILGHRPAALLVSGIVVLTSACIVSSCAHRHSAREEAELQKILVEPGTEDDAFKYYEETFDQLGLNPKKLTREALVRSQNLGIMLEFLGYKDLRPVEVEDTPSVELMKRPPANAILASAFFAPKITDVSKPPIDVGWRKVVRLNAAPGSDAEKRGIVAGFLLFNKFQGRDRSLDPFEPRHDHSNESKNTQLLLVHAESAKERPVYFFMYGPISAGGQLQTFLKASFDARAPNIPDENKYYVPQPCAECHGGKISQEADYRRLKVNYLDTDHWFDRLGDDFAFLKDSSFGVLYDGGKDETTPKFATAFDVIRRLNNEIKAQNERVEPTGPPSFQLRAVTKWVELHMTSLQHQDYFSRALPANGGAAEWKAAIEPDRQLLPMLNQYCFRCHSSLRFSVFDRPEVVERKGKILRFLYRLPVEDKFRMPQDRILADDVKERLKGLVEALPPSG